MCGIAGLIYKEKESDGSNAIRQITDLISHRGPDGYGFWNKENVYFGHRRLSILDLSELGAQPMEYNGYVITYNGEVYNYVEVKKELEQLGYSFRSHCDTEVILAAYQCWGVNCLTRFNGMWSLALYDPYKNIVFCSRDRFGIKPFYYLQQNDKFIFGSEIKQLLHFRSNVKARQQAITHYLAFTLIDGSEDTFYEDIKNLPGSHYLIYHLNTNKIDISRYYQIQTHDEYKKLNYNDALEMFQNHFQRSINWRLRSDVRLGTCLSGGLDSSFIALKASRSYESNQRFSAFTAASIDEDWNEEGFAKKVADTLNLDWHVTKPTTKDFCDDLTNVCKVLEEPFVSPSVFMQHYVMRIANQQGLKVLLDGQGGDETLFGYNRYIIAMGKKLSGMDKIRFLLQAQKKYKLTYSSLFSTYFYFSRYKVRKRYAAHKLRGFKAGLMNEIDDNYFKSMANAYNDPLHLQQMEITSSQIPALLRYEDRNSMYYSIETRLPFLDWELLEFNLSLPIEYKIKNGWSKYLIRDSVDQQLPDAVTWRTNKFGFNSPDRDWLSINPDFKKAIRESVILNQIFSDPLAVADVKNGMFWKLLNIACWEKVYNVTL